MLNLQDEMSLMDSRFTEIKFQSIKTSDLDKKNTEFINKDSSWRTSLYIPQVHILKLEKLSNISAVYFDRFDYGAELSFHVSEYESGPYIEVLKKKYYQRSLLRKVKLGSIPLKYLKIVVHSGAQITPSKVHIFGFPSEDSVELFGKDYFEVLVANPVRIMYK